jgi:hypothetical protein
MAWLWTYMFDRVVPNKHPQGRMVLLADCRGLRLSLAMGEGQVAGRALGVVAEANPERMVKTLIVNAPTWFNLIWKARPRAGGGGRGGGGGAAARAAPAAAAAAAPPRARPRPPQPRAPPPPPPLQVMAPHLAEATRAKVTVLTSSAAAAEELQRHLGPELVPAEFGGRCMRPLDALPAQRELLEFVAALRPRGGSGGGRGGSGGGARE